MVRNCDKVALNSVVTRSEHSYKGKVQNELIVPNFSKNSNIIIDGVCSGCPFNFCSLGFSFKIHIKIPYSSAPEVTVSVKMIDINTYVIGFMIPVVYFAVKT